MHGFPDHLTAFFSGSGILELLQFSRVCKAIATSELSLLYLVTEGGSKLLLKEFTKMTGRDQGSLVCIPVIQVMNIPAIDQSHGH